MTSSTSAVRGGSLRAYVDYLRGAGAFDRVLAAIPAETRLYLLDPPTATEWIDHRHTLNVFTTYASIAGPAAVRDMTLCTARGALSERLRPVVHAAFAFFGASPATIFTHAEPILRFNVRGQRLRYFPEGAKAGTIEIRLVERHPPAVYYDAWAGIFDFVFELCGTRGRASLQGAETDGADGVGRFRVEWE